MDHIIKRHNEMVYPAVRMLAGTVGGSGTVLYSRPDGEGKVHTLVIGCHHVIGELVKIKEEWDPRVGRNIKVERRGEATCEIFRYNRVSECVGVTGIRSQIVAYNARWDLALLEMEDTEHVYEYVAEMVPQTEMDKVLLSAETWAVGAALLHPPILTQGFLNFKNDQIENEEYWMSSAQIIFGNSGGSMYWYSLPHDRYFFIGVPARISLNIAGFSANPITHMGYFVPPTTVYKFLEENDYHFIFDPGQTYEECAARRTERLEKERERVAMIQGLIERKE